MDISLDRAPCGYLAFTDDGVINRINSTLSAMLGYTAADLEGQHFETVLGAGGRIFFQTHFFPILKLHGAAEEIYLTLRTRAGSEIPVLTNALRRETAGVGLSECIVVRMLQRSRYEDELVRARQMAESASEVKAKFLSMMSHELRTPLQAISGYCDLLLERISGPLTAEQESDLKSVRSASEELVRLLNDILDFARLDSGIAELTLSTVCVGAALARAEVLITPRLAEAKLRYTRAACADEFFLRGNADRLQQVLLNLLTNAIKFTPAGGEITVECSGDAQSTRISVRDTGFGIPAGNLERIFEPFVQVDRHRIEHRQRGVGLGLAISRELIRAMGGDLSVASAEDAGSTFTISLPAASAPAMEPAAGPH